MQLSPLDLRAKDQRFLQTHFGKAGLHYYDIRRGIDRRPVAPIACKNRAAWKRQPRATSRALTK